MALDSVPRGAVKHTTQHGKGVSATGYATNNEARHTNEELMRVATRVRYLTTKAEAGLFIGGL